MSEVEKQAKTREEIRIETRELNRTGATDGTYNPYNIVHPEVQRRLNQKFVPFEVAQREIEKLKKKQVRLEKAERHLPKMPIYIKEQDRFPFSNKEDNLVYLYAKIKEWQEWFDKLVKILNMEIGVLEGKQEFKHTQLGSILVVDEVEEGKQEGETTK